MSNPSTRSLYGSTYLYKENRLNKKGTSSYGKHALEKAQSLAVTMEVYPASNSTIKKFNLYQSEKSASESLRVDHSKIINVIQSYNKNRSYQGLVYSTKDISVNSLMTFAEDWIEFYHELIQASLEDWKSSARYVMEEEAKKHPAFTNVITNNPEYIENALQKLKESTFYTLNEITKIQQKISAKDVQTNTGDTLPATNTMQKKRAGDVASFEKSLLRGKTTNTSKKNILSNMWKDEKKIESALILGNFIFSRKRMPQNYLNTIDNLTIDDRMKLTTLQLEEIFATTTTYLDRNILDFMKILTIEPVGQLYLERLDFTPIGYVKGEMLYSLPMTPGEKTTVSHKEWSHTTEEYVKEVIETIEEENSRELSESTELTQSTNTEQEVGWKAGTNVTTSYSGGGFSITASGSLDWNKNTSKAVARSSAWNQEVTHKAASRSKSSHKISFKVSKKAYSEDEHVKVIENKSDEPVRWDFYQLMKKWQIDLYHIGERLTYDIVVPEPGDYLLRKYVELEQLQKILDDGDPFDLIYKAFLTKKDSSSMEFYDFVQLIHESNLSVDLNRPPGDIKRTIKDMVELHEKAAQHKWRTIDINFPDGYTIVYDSIEYQFDLVDGVFIKHCYGNKVAEINPRIDQNKQDIFDSQPINSYTWAWSYWVSEALAPSYYEPHIAFQITAVPTEELMLQWRTDTLNDIRDAARQKWLSRQEQLQNEMSRLVAEITGKDSLKLRQMEREEIMKSVLRWLLGPDFEFYPDELLDSMIVTDSSEAVNPLDYYDDKTGLLKKSLLGNQMYKGIMIPHGELIRFIQQAIEWENVNWILNPYFWTLPQRWDFKSSIEHPDFYHRSFLRAGCARVIIPIRPGFEKAWFEYIEQGTLDEDHPYISLANELKNIAEQNYAYTPDANREEIIETGIHKDRWFEYTPTGALHIMEGEEPADQ